MAEAKKEPRDFLSFDYTEFDYLTFEKIKKDVVNDRYHLKADMLHAYDQTIYANNINMTPYLCGGQRPYLTFDVGGGPLYGEETKTIDFTRKELEEMDYDAFREAVATRMNNLLKPEIAKGFLFLDSLEYRSDFYRAISPEGKLKLAVEDYAVEMRQQRRPQAEVMKNIQRILQDVFTQKHAMG